MRASLWNHVTKWIHAGTFLSWTNHQHCYISSHVTGYKNTGWSGCPQVQEEEGCLRGGRGWGTWCLDSSRKIRLQRYFVLGFPFLLLFPLLNRTGDSISFVATTDVCFVVMGSVLFWRFVSAAGKQCPRWPKRARFVQIWAFLTRAGETCLPNAFSWLLSQHASMPMDA